MRDLGVFSDHTEATYLDVGTERLSRGIKASNRIRGQKALQTERNFNMEHVSEPIGKDPVEAKVEEHREGLGLRFS